MRRFLASAALIAAMSACSSEPAPSVPVPATVATTPPATAAAGPSTNVETDTACKLVAEALQGEFAQLDDRATIEAIVLNATKSNIKAIMLAGVQMDGRYSAWSRADGGGDSQQELDDAAGRLRAACVDAGVID